MRDSQLSKVEKAMKALVPFDGALDKDQQRRCCKRIFRLKWTKTHFQKTLRTHPHGPKLTFPDGADGSFSITDNCVGLTPTKPKRVVLHAMAWWIIKREHARGDVAAHGWEFCALYLRLVRMCMSRDAAKALQAAFKTERVRFRPKRQMSAESRAAAAKRLADARAMMSIGHVVYALRDGVDFTG